MIDQPNRRIAFFVVGGVIVFLLTDVHEAGGLLQATLVARDC